MQRPPPLLSCPHCGKPQADLAKHLRWGPVCKRPVLPPPATAPRRELPREAEALLRAELRAEVAWDLAELRNKYGCSEPAISFLKTASDRWSRNLNDANYQRLDHAIGPMSEAQYNQTVYSGFFDKLSTKAQERAQATQDMPYQAPKVQHFDPARTANDTFARMDMVESLELRLVHNTSFRKRVMETSRRWNTGGLFQKEITDLDADIESFEDGVVARFHPKLLKKAPENHLKIALLCFVDDVEAPPPRTCMLELRGGGDHVCVWQKYFCNECTWCWRECTVCERVEPRNGGWGHVCRKRPYDER